MSVRRIDQADQRASQRTFAAAAFSNHTESLAFPDVQTYIVHRLDGSVLSAFSFKIYFYMIRSYKRFFFIFRHRPDLPSSLLLRHTAST